MGKTGLFCTSLVAAIPAGYLSYELVHTFLTRAEGLETIMYVIAGLTLAISALITITPIGILLFSPSSTAPAAPKEANEKAAADSTEAMGADDDLVDDADEFAADDDEFEFEEDEDEWE